MRIVGAWPTRCAWPTLSRSNFFQLTSWWLKLFSVNVYETQWQQKEEHRYKDMFRRAMVIMAIGVFWADVESVNYHHHPLNFDDELYYTRTYTVYAPKKLTCLARKSPFFFIGDTSSFIFLGGAVELQLRLPFDDVLPPRRGENSWGW